MLDLNLNGWLNGITATVIVLYGAIIGPYIMVKARKLRANVLMGGALMGVCATSLWLGPCVEFLWTVFFDSHITVEAYSLLSYTWVFPTSTFAQYVGSKLLFPEKKALGRLIIVSYIIIGVLFLYFIYFENSAAFSQALPWDETKDLIDVSFNRGHITFYLIIAFLGAVVAIEGFGALISGLKATGIVRKKLLILSTMFFLFTVVAVFDALFAPGIILFIVRGGMIACGIMIYLALAPPS